MEQPELPADVDVERVLRGGAPTDLTSRFRVGAERFSTRGLRGSERVDKWEAHNAKALLGLAAKTIEDEALDATEINLHLPRLDFAHVSANAHVVERTAKHVRTKPAESIVLYFTLFGDAFYFSNDAVRTLTPGSVLVCDTDRPFVRGFAKGLKELVLMVPKPLFAEITDDAVPHREEPLVLNFGKSRRANDFATDIADIMTAALSDPESAALESTEEEVADLLRGIFRGTGSSSTNAQYRSILSLVDRHLRSTELSAAMIAQQCGFSQRQVSRVLSAHGQSFPRLVLERRLEVARRLLVTTTSSAMSVGDVASFCGFASHAQFTRSFRSHFGYTPSEAKRASSTSSDLSFSANSLT